MRDSMDDWCVESTINISKSLKILKIHQRMYLGEVNGGIVMDHFMSVKNGLKLLNRFLDVCEYNCDLIPRIRYMVSYMKQKLDSLRYLGKDESIAMNLEHAYADLREEMKDVIIKSGTYEYDAIFPKIIIGWYRYNESKDFLYTRINKLLSSDCKAVQITPVRRELEDIKNMLESLGPFFTYAKYVEASDQSFGPSTEKEREVFAIITAVLDRASCFIYLCFVGKMNNDLIFSLKNIFFDLVIEETEIMRMYLIIDVDSVENLESHISMSLRLLEWNKKYYLCTGMRPALEDHFMSIELGLQFLVQILKVSTNNDLKLRIQNLVAIVKPKLYSLPHYQEDQNLVVKLQHAYCELRKEMSNVVIIPGSDDYDILFPEIFKERSYFYTTNDFLIETISVLVTSNCKDDQIAHLMKELEELQKKLTVFIRPFLDIYLKSCSLTEDEEKVMAALTTFFDRASCLIYVSYIGNLNEDMLVSLKKHLSLLIEESEIKEMSLVLGIMFDDELESDIDISLSLLSRQEEYLICPTNGVMLDLEDHILSLKHGIEFLKWINKFIDDDGLKRSVILLATKVKKKLERLIYIQEDECLNMDVNGAYADLREDMKNLIIDPSTNNYAISFPFFFSGISDLRDTTDFLLEKITTLVTTNCKADQIAPLKKELQDLTKMVAFLKPLLRYEVTNFSVFFTVLHEATVLIFMSFVGKMDIEMMLSVKSSIARVISEIDILEVYTMILNEELDFGRAYLEEDLYLLENLLMLLKRNFKSLSDANSKLYKALIDIHIFLLGQPPNVFLRKLHILKTLSQDILSHSIPIVCSCYLEHTELYVSIELNLVLKMINHIKSEVQEIKLYYYPTVDDLGFLKFFSGSLEDLLKNQEISAIEEIPALHFELQQLLCLPEVRNQELDETPWTNIINMVYQAEYIIDLCLANSSRDLGLILNLAKIIGQLKNVRSDMNDAVKNVRADMNDAVEDDAMNFKPQVLGTTTQVGDYDRVVGLHEEIRNIKEHLVKGKTKLGVVSIVGMAGVGKTTLALTLYKNPIMADRFDILAWCTVSQSYHNQQLLLAILNQVNAFDINPRSTFKEQELADHLWRSLRKRRYLIVFDDIWDCKLWNYLKRYLPDDGNGSRVLITTRNKDVADQIRSKVDELHGLSEEKSWELFLEKIHDKESLSEDLLKCSKRIVEHCKGLPLSIVVIAGILSSIERTENKWNEIAQSVSSLVLSDSQGKCKAILELSYNHLPNHLRSCFLYVASYPEDQEISVDHLILHWIAEGLILGTESDSPEEVANKYMEELIRKSLVIPAKERSLGAVKTFRLHDLLRDFCLNKAKEKHFFTVCDSRNRSRPLQDPRRLIIHGYGLTAPILKQFSCHSIRSLTRSDYLEAYEIEETIRSHHLVLLNVLEGGTFDDRFPNISSLIHLRYLDLGLGYRSISVLPDFSFTRFSISVLPDFIWDMVKLRHVHITPGASFKIHSNRLANSSILLENLRFLSFACISWVDCKWLTKLLGLERLDCLFVDQNLEDDFFLRINDLKEDYEYVKEDKEGDDLEEADDMEQDEDDGGDDDDDLKEDNDKEDDALDEAVDDLEKNKYDGGDNDDDDLNDSLDEDDDLEKDEEGDDQEEDYEDEKDNDFEEDDFQMVRFNSQLISLKLESSGRYWKRFISSCQLPNSLQKLTLAGVYLKSNDISKIGSELPYLEVFKIYRCRVPFPCKWYVKDEDFPKLKVLKLSKLDISKLTVSEYSFPNLERLWVNRCDYLGVIPLDFGNFPKLRLITVRRCKPSVNRSAKKIEKIQHEGQNTEMRVHIHPTRL